MGKMRSKKRGLKQHAFLIDLGCQNEGLRCQKEVGALYLLQIKRFRRSLKLIEKGDPNGIKKASKLKPCAQGMIC